MLKGCAESFSEVDQDCQPTEKPRTDWAGFSCLSASLGLRRAACWRLLGLYRLLVLFGLRGLLSRLFRLHRLRNGSVVLGGVLRRLIGA
jgi:hypothetical protein